MFDLYYEENGQGKVIVLLPGLLASTRYWNDISEILSNDFRVIVIDQLGFGKSPKPDSLTDYSIEANIKSYKKLFDKLNITKVDLMVGYSSSSILASSFCYEYPGLVERLLLITPPIYKSREESIISLNNSFRTYKSMMCTNWRYFFIPFVTIFRPILTLFAPLIITHVKTESARDVFKFTWKSLYNSIENIIIRQNAASVLENLTMTIKILYAKEDNIVNEKNLLKINRLNKNISLIKLNCSHQIPLERPGEVIDTAIELLNS